MPNDDVHLPTPPLVRWRSSLFSIPGPVKRIFDHFPLLTYAPNSLPLRCPPPARHENILHLFTTTAGAEAGRPSFNPACLKWQTYLKFYRVPFRTVQSNNHAAPSGTALPFLLPAHPGADAVPNGKFKKWCAAAITTSHGEQNNEEDRREEVYAALLENRIRKAWLFQLYLHPPNTFLLETLYINPQTKNHMVRLALTSQLRRAASTEISPSSTATIDMDDILHDALEAFSALSAILGDDKWFFGSACPGEMDAGVFAYTHLLLDEAMRWGENMLGQGLVAYENLVQHRGRILTSFY